MLADVWTVLRPALAQAFWWAWPLGALRSAWFELYPNLAASGLIFVGGYLGKVRPHLHAQAAHRHAVTRSLAELHRKLDAAAADGKDVLLSPQQPPAELAIFDGINHPDAATVLADGLAGALLYAGTPNSAKNVTAAQYADYAAHQLLVILAFEHLATDISGGAAAGARNAHALAVDAAAKHIPFSVPALATIDEHVSAADIAGAMAYQSSFRGALKQMGWTGPIGIYGFSEVLEAAHRAGNADFYFGAGNRSSLPPYTNIWQDNTAAGHIVVGGSSDDKDWILVPLPTPGGPLVTTALSAADIAALAHAVAAYKNPADANDVDMHQHAVDATAALAAVKAIEDKVDALAAAVAKLAAQQGGATTADQVQVTGGTLTFGAPVTG